MKNYHMRLETLITYLENNNFIEITTTKKNNENILYKKNNLCIFASSKWIEVFKVVNGIYIGTNKVTIDSIPKLDNLIINF